MANGRSLWKWLRPGEHRFQKRMAVQVFVTSFLGIVIASGVVYVLVRREVRRDRESILIGAVKQLTVELDNTLAMWLADANQVSESAAVLTRLPERYAKLNIYEEILPKNDFDYIAMVDNRNGRIIQKSATLERSNALTFEELVPKEGSWIKQVENTGEVRGLSCTTMQLPVPGQYIAFGTLLPKSGNDNTRSGASASHEVIVSFLNCDRLQSPIDTFKKSLVAAGFPSADPYVVASDGFTVIADSNPDNVGTNIKTSYQHVRDFSPEKLISVLTEAPRIASTTDDQARPSILEYKFNGRKIGAFATISYPSSAENAKYRISLLHDFDWHVAVGIREDDIFRLMQSFPMLFILVSAVVSCMVLIVTIYSSRSMQVSLSEFTRLIKDATRGNVSSLSTSNRNDEIGALGEALNQLLISVRSNRPFERLANPYVVGNPIRSSDMFFGRNEDLRWIGERLGQTGNKFISLVGQRRIGKTSLLHQINAGKAGGDAITFFFDTQEILPEISSDTEFYDVITRDLIRQLKNKQIKAPVITGGHATATSVSQLLRFISELGRGTPVVLLFDEIDNLEDKFRRQQLVSQNILLFFAGLLDGDIPLCFVTTASERSDLTAERWGTLTAKMMTRRIGLLAPLDARRLIEEPLRESLLYRPMMVDRILRLTAGHPYYTQVICQNLVDHLNEKQISVVGPDELEYAVKFLMANPPLPLAYIWDTASIHSKVVLAALADLLDDDSGSTPINSILDKITNYMPEAAQQVEVRAAIATLRNEDWIDEVQPSMFRFRADLLRLWLKQYHSIYSTAFESRRGATAS